MEFGKHYLRTCLKNFNDLKELGEKAFSQTNDVDFFWTPDEESNSIAIIVKHLSGNMLSRWTDFLTTDGEKNFRKRDREFELSNNEDKDSFLNKWEDGWRCLIDALNLITEDDLLKDVTIRSQKHTVVQAINRQLTHYGFHIGQIVYLAKLRSGKEWKTLSVERGKSEEFNEEMKKKHTL
ncbi:MAG: DUF1572 domain-containing protein [Asgard group archaeon]|nr:DUF1572 domain-containing protein [Asgard group archaeon]